MEFSDWACLVKVPFLTNHVHIGLKFTLCKGHKTFNPFPNKPWFLRVCSTSLLKTLWEKVKLHMMSNFSFCHSVFYLFEELFCYFCQLWNCRLQTLSVWKSLKCVVWERVKLLFEEMHFSLHSGNRYIKLRTISCLTIKWTILIHYPNLLKFWILEFLEISTLLNHSVTIDNRADSKLIILANKRKYSFSSML